MINGFLEIYSQKPTILVADVILDTTMKMMIPIYLKKADTETNMKIFLCFHEKYIISAPKPQKNGVFVVDHKKTTKGGKRVDSCLE